MIRELLPAQNVVEYIGSANFRAKKLPAETAKCDNFQGFSIFCRAAAGNMPGIVASQYSYVSRLTNQAACTEYYNSIVDIFDIGGESFAACAQAMLVDHLHAEYCDGIANWCKTFWSDARGGMCLAHSWYAGCNNNMGVEVSWNNIKKLLPANCTL
jgi:hypothetical protein